MEVLYMKTKINHIIFIAALCFLILSLGVGLLAGCSRKTENSYKATVPDTLDLAVRAGLAVQGLTNVLNKDADYAPFGSAVFGDSATSYRPIWGDVVNAIILGRNMSGSDYNSSYDKLTIDGMNKYLDSSVVKDDENTLPESLGQFALINQYALNPTDDLKKLLDNISQKHIDSASIIDNYAYDYDGPWQDESGGHGIIGYGENFAVNGKALRVVSIWANSGKSRISQQLTELAVKYKNYLLLPKLWKAEVTPKVVVDEDRGHFNGDMSAYASGLLGLLTYAEGANDNAVKKLVQSSYEYIRDYGLKSIGLFGDISVTSEMTQLAIKMSQMGVADYWDDAERYLRNELAEKQITDTKGRYADAAGLFFTDSSYPTHISPVNQVADLDSTAQAVQAMYFAWNAIVSGDKNIAQVNMLLNRSSELLDINSYLPYEGKVKINIKATKTAAVRLPLWVDWSQAAVAVNGTSRDIQRTGQYVLITDLKKGDIVAITFPIKEWEETGTLMWREGRPYIKSTDPGVGWRAQAVADKFTLTFRGYTLVGITSATDKTGSDPYNYLLYQRDALKSETTPMITVQRFVPKTTIN